MAALTPGISKLALVKEPAAAKEKEVLQG